MPTNAINDTGVKYVYDKLDTKKADKVASATNGNLAGLNASGNLTDSGWDGTKDTTSMSGNPISITGLKSNQLAVNPVITFEPIQAGSGTPSPSNIRAISGYDKVEVESCGKNLVDESTVDIRDVTGTRTYRASLAPILLKAGTYTISWASKTVDLYLTHLKDYSRDDVNTNPYIFTLSQTEWVMLRSGAYNVSQWDVVHPQIEEGSSATTYEPYHKTTDLSESLGQTVYGGSLDVRTGVLTVTHKSVKLNTLSWTYYSQGLQFYADISDKANGQTNVISSIYKTENSSADFIVIGHPLIGRAHIRDTQYNGNITNWLNATGDQTICYELATPFTIQLTPHEISLLKDYAYVSTNGTNIALDYHNGELASLADVSQLGETVNELGAKVLSFVRLSYSFGTVTNGTRYTFDVTGNYSHLNRNTVKAITIYSVKGSLGADAEGIYNQNFGIGDPNKLFINYNCKMSQSNAVMEVDILYLA